MLRLGQTAFLLPAAACMLDRVVTCGTVHGPGCGGPAPEWAAGSAQHRDFHGPPNRQTPLGSCVLQARMGALPCSPGAPLLPPDLATQPAQLPGLPTEEPGFPPQMQLPDLGTQQQQQQQQQQQALPPLLVPRPPAFGLPPPAMRGVRGASKTQATLPEPTSPHQVCQCCSVHCHALQAPPAGPLQTLATNSNVA